MAPPLRFGFRPSLLFLLLVDLHSLGCVTAMADARPAANKRARHGGSPQPSSQAPEDEDDQPCSGVVMAVAVHGNRCGVAWFDDGKVRWALATKLTHLFEASGRQQEPAEACKKAAG